MSNTTVSNSSLLVLWMVERTMSAILMSLQHTKFSIILLNLGTFFQFGTQISVIFMAADHLACATKRDKNYILLRSKTMQCQQLKVLQLIGKSILHQNLLYDKVYLIFQQIVVLLNSYFFLVLRNPCSSFFIILISNKF